MNTKTWMGGLLLTVATLTTTSLLAQTMAPADATAPTSSSTGAQRGRMGRMNRGGGMNGGGYMAADPATRAQKMTDRFTKQLGLDEATSKKVYAATLTRDQQIDAIQKGSDDNRAKAKNLKTNADQYKSALQGILTADQFTKFQQMRQRGGGRGNGMKADDGTDDKPSN